MKIENRLQKVEKAMEPNQKGFYMVIIGLTKEALGKTEGSNHSVMTSAWDKLGRHIGISGTHNRQKEIAILKGVLALLPESISNKIRAVVFKKLGEPIP